MHHIPQPEIGYIKDPQSTSRTGAIEGKIYSSHPSQDFVVSEIHHLKYSRPRKSGFFYRSKNQGHFYEFDQPHSITYTGAEKHKPSHFRHHHHHHDHHTQKEEIKSETMENVPGIPPPPPPRETKDVKLSGLNSEQSKPDRTKEFDNEEMKEHPYPLNSEKLDEHFAQGRRMSPEKETYDFIPPTSYRYEEKGYQPRRELSKEYYPRYRYYSPSSYFQTIFDDYEDDEGIDDVESDWDRDYLSFPFPRKYDSPEYYRSSRIFSPDREFYRLNRSNDDERQGYSVKYQNLELEYQYPIYY